MANDYIYAVARVRGKELQLLPGSFIESLASAKSYEEALRLLADHGWGDGKEEPKEILRGERDKTWEFIRELVKDDLSVFDVFLYANDYHNLKAAVKEAASGKEQEGIYLPADQCTIDPEKLATAMREHDYEALPEEMREVAKEAFETLLHTGDGQLCDVIIDRAALIKIGKAGKASGNEILQKYGELTVSSADIKTAIRANRTGKDLQFLTRALAPCDSLDVEDLAKAAAESLDAIYEYLDRTPYADAVPEIRKSPTAFERWCDDTVIRSMRPEIHNPFGIGPLAAYLIARENEIKTVRIILSGKLNELPEESIRERVREMYV